MTDLTLDEKTKEAQLKKLVAETSKIEAETSKTNAEATAQTAQLKKLVAEISKIESETLKTNAEAAKLWLEFAKLVIPAMIGLFGGWFLQSNNVSSVILEKNTAVFEKNQAVFEKNQAVSGADVEASIDPLKKELEEVRTELKKVNPELIKKPLIYIQFQGYTTRGFIDELRGSLQGEFNAPGGQRISGAYTSEVRYFSQDDKEKANHLAESVTAFFKSKGCSLNLPVKFNKSTGGKTSPIEIWLADEDFCG